MVVKLGKVLAVSKQAARKFDERFNLGKLSELELRKQYKIKISNRFAVLENINDKEDINRTWENTEGRIKSLAKKSPSLYALKQHKLYFIKII